MNDDGRSFVGESRAPLDAPTLVRTLTAPVGPLSRLTCVAATASTNADVLEGIRSGEDWPHMSALVADHQTDGRGRAGRSWETPPGTALTVSFVLRPEGIERQGYGWIPLLVGLAVQRTLSRDGLPALLKWPNDVVVDDPQRLALPGWERARKVAGILCEVEGDTVVAGVGLNVSQREDELPVPQASSLALLGAPTIERGVLLGSLAYELSAVMATWADGGGAGGMEAAIMAVCGTLGRKVIVDRPGDEPLEGMALGLSHEGGLMIETVDGRTVTVLAGDVSLRVGE